MGCVRAMRLPICCTLDVVSMLRSCRVNHLLPYMKSTPGSTCCHCDTESLNADYHKAFAVCVCNQCRKYEPLISKTNAKTQYLLSDADLSKLGTLQKQNPQHKDWAPMKMFLLSQVESVAVGKYGSLDAMSQRKQQKVKDRIEDRAKKRKAAERSGLADTSCQHQLAAVLNRYSQDSPSQEEDFMDTADGKRKKRFEPGLAAADVEEI